MSDEDIQPVERKSPPLLRRLLISAGVLLLAFLIGFIPMWLKARQAASSLAQTEHQLTLARMQNSLASAVIDARRGEYEPARQTLSQFYNTLSVEIDKGKESSLSEAQRGGLQPLLSGRDEIITLLARSDPASAEKVTDIYVRYRKVMSVG